MTTKTTAPDSARMVKLDVRAQLQDWTLHTLKIYGGHGIPERLDYDGFVEYLKLVEQRRTRLALERIADALEKGR